MTEGVLNMGAVLRELDFGNGKTSVLFENGVQVLYDHGKYVDDVPGSWGEREINAWFEGIEKGKEAGTAIIAKLEAELEQVKRERDAAVETWRGFCAKCEWVKRQFLSDGRMDDRCKTCRENNKCNWQWRGVKEAKPHDD
jgi:hypothetical protein